MSQQISAGGRLAIVLRQCQWDLDAIAFKLPRNQNLTDPVTEQDCKNLADQLEELAGLLRSASFGADVVDIGHAPSATRTTHEIEEGD